MAVLVTLRYRWSHHRPNRIVAITQMSILIEANVDCLASILQISVARRILRILKKVSVAQFSETVEGLALIARQITQYSKIIQFSNNKVKTISSKFRCDNLICI